jgi:hypothetical protein
LRDLYLDECNDVRPLWALVRDKSPTSMVAPCIGRRSLPPPKLRGVRGLSARTELHTLNIYMNVRVEG